MAHSFFTGTDLELYGGTKNFAEKISISPSSYGLSVEQVAAYQVLSDSYRAAYLVTTVPATKTKSATAAKNTAKMLLRSMASDLARIISGTAVSDEQKLSLGLNVRKAPSPIDGPGTPESFKAELRTDGTLLLKWKCKHPAGTRGVLYQVYRSADGDDNVYLGGAGRRKFIDASFPARAASLTYTIHATRTTKVGVKARFLVKFGDDSAAATTGASKPTKLAA